MEALTDLKHILHSKRANIYLYQGACPRIINLLQKSWICAVSRFFSSNSGAILLKKPKNSPKTSFPSLRFLFSDKLLEKCRLLQKGGRVVYLTEETKSKHYWNIPIANTTVILLGTGTSITQGAVRMLCSAGVLFGFSGGGGTPLLASNEIEWMTPQSEYRPTEYIQSWMKFWFDANKRLKVAKYFQKQRINYLQTTWKNDQDLKLVLQTICPV